MNWLRAGARGCAALALGVAMLAASSPPVASGAVAPTAKAPSGSGGSGAHDDHRGHHAPGGHDGSEGNVLVAAPNESVKPGKSCARGAQVRSYALVARNVDITLNRYLDHDPEGRMFVLESASARVDAEMAANEKARTSGTEPAVSLGLQGDAIQPPTLRVNQGECLRVTLRNALAGNEPVSFHLHGSSLRVAGTKEPALSTNLDAVARSGRPVTYEWWVVPTTAEGTHYFHSHGDTRKQTSHGLFGAVVVEPAGSEHLDPRTGAAGTTDWDAIIRTRDGQSFREFALYYHEVGDESFLLRGRAGVAVPIVDPLLGAYRPGSRAVNYRSEPFLNRMNLQQQRQGRFDESLAYSSYTFGDPATPVLRTYLGEPVKQRVIHAGSEVFHVHHVHGGSIRWRRQPGVEPTGFKTGLDKHPQLLPTATDRTDSQSLGPSETFDVENECGAGGCQQSVGDFLYHCHVAQHYFAGMWGIWRVYNTLQNGDASTDALPTLRELTDRAGQVRAAVAADQLTGAAADAAAIGRQLPPAGVPRGYDASVIDIQRDGSRWLNEPETAEVWPGYRSRAPGTRPPILFDPATGRLAYPFLRPHLGRRPPFAPNHGPAPFLDPTESGRDPPAPGASGPASLCPTGTRPKSIAIDAISIPVALNRRARVVDPEGELYVLREDVARVRADPSMRRPLTIRANAGEDCVDILFRSQLADNAINHGFAKANLHIHFVQFDVQASDGVDTGFNYEQSVRPFTIEGARLTTAAGAGASTITVDDAARYQPGVLLGIGMERDDRLETRVVKAVSGSRIELDAPLTVAHARGEIVSTEFVRYRWYPDVQFGTAYFHDHVNALNSWRHGLFGALVAEPPGSTYRDPRTGAPITSGPVADIHTRSRVTADVTGSFRELALFLQDDNPINRVGRSTGSSLNLRAEPLGHRGRDPASWFSSAAAGEPETPVLEAYLGDPLVFRTLVAGTNDVHTWHLDGHWFRREPFSAQSPPTANIGVGISERFDLSVPAAGGPQRMAGDYLHYGGRTSKLAEGSWGIVRVHNPGPSAGGLKVLAGHETPPAPATAVCPPAAPRRHFDVVAMKAALPMLGRDPGLVYALAADRAAIESGRQRATPLVLRVGVGDCIEVTLDNATDGPVTFHTDLLAADPMTSAGVTAGRNPAQAVAPRTSRMYELFAAPEVGETTALVRDWGDVTRNPRRGLYGAIVVGPRGARYTEPRTGADVSAASRLAVDVVAPTGAAYRDVVVFQQDDDAGIGSHRMPYTRDVEGVVGMNYGAAPFAPRTPKTQGDPAAIFRTEVGGDPATAVFEAYAGDPIRFHVLAPVSEQVQVFTVEGHEWPIEPGRQGTTMVSSIQLGALDALTLRFGAGGRDLLPGAYVFGNHREAFRAAGLWGVLRVRPACRAAPNGLRFLPDTCDRRAGWIPLLLFTALAVAIAVPTGLFLRRRLPPALRARRARRS